MSRLRKSVIGFAVVLPIFLFFNNTSRFAKPRTGQPRIIVHRGISQRYTVPTASIDVCTAAHMLPPLHDYLENTIPSMQASFNRGADVVEFDVHATRDGQFAVFHDRSLDCRTDGRGLTREHAMAELRSLDVGYGYTADQGRTYPFRGKGVGLLVSMDDVLERFPDRSFLIDVKGNVPQDAELLAARLNKLSSEHRSRLMVFARDRAVRILRERAPDVGSFSTESIASCLVQYIAYGWTGLIPGVCHGAPVFVPSNVMPWLWGWPNKFLDRLEARGSSIIAMGAIGGRDFPAGIDTDELFSELPQGFDGGIWTNNVELLKARLSKNEALNQIERDQQR